jgi:hypothetical protein
VHPKTSAEEWQKRVERWRASGLTADQFAAELGINAGTLKFWQYKLRKEKRIEGVRKRCSAGKSAVSTTAPAFVEVRSSYGDARFELELRNGRLIRVPEGFDGNALERLVAILEPQ